MASFVHPEFPAAHAGVQRAEAAIDAVHRMRSGFDSAKGLSAMLLAAVVAAVVVVADQMIDSWADGHLLAAWVLLWAVSFAGLAVFAGTARRTASRLVAALDAWSVRVAQARADERLWAIAQRDPRIMADLQNALLRAERG